MPRLLLAPLLALVLLLQPLLTNGWVYRGTSTTLRRLYSLSPLAASTDEREAAWNKRNKRKEKVGSMPLSQKWYKDKQHQISKGQKRAITALWPIYGLELRYKQTVGISNNSLVYTTLDIGFGMGHSITYMANRGRVAQAAQTAQTAATQTQTQSVEGEAGNPLGTNTNTSKTFSFIGCEIHRAGIASALQKLNASAINNTKLIRHDAMVLLENHLVDDSIDAMCVYFPDPVGVYHALFYVLFSRVSLFRFLKPLRAALSAMIAALSAQPALRAAEPALRAALLALRAVRPALRSARPALRAVWTTLRAIWTAPRALRALRANRSASFS
jgi:hypothetical protein